MESFEMIDEPNIFSSTITSKSDSWSIETFLRIRPSLPVGSNSVISCAAEVKYLNKDFNIKDGTSRSVIEIDIPADADPGLVHNNSTSGKLRYEFDKVLDFFVTQDEIFNYVAKSKVIGAMDGINCTIFAYGQTGSGKTYTICGGETYQQRGLIPRSIELIFDEVRIRQQTQSFIFKCQISFTEIYKEAIYDLLDAEMRANPIDEWRTVQLLETENGIVLKNINVFSVISIEDALQLFFMGSNHRITNSTSMNDVSSRSHAVFTIVLECEGIKTNRTIMSSGKINLVDLAGSERMYKLSNTKDAIKEAKSINLSLHFLEQVIISLREQNQIKQQRTNLLEKSNSESTVKGTNAITSSHGFIPYRNSVLTNMLRDSLGGNCKSSFLLTITKERQHFEETVATCRFGQRCGEVKVQISANTEVGLSDQLKDLNAKIRNLEKQLLIIQEQKRDVELELINERELRKKQTEIRIISATEKAKCKSCVQALLAAAKESIVNCEFNPSSGVPSSFASSLNSTPQPFSNTFRYQTPSIHEAKQNNFVRFDGLHSAQEKVPDGMNGTTSSTSQAPITLTRSDIDNSIIERSQEVLYDAVEVMDKAVLVELSTALGGLVQSMYIERELGKREDKLKKSRVKESEDQHEAKRSAELQHINILKSGRTEDLADIPNLPESKINMLTNGAVFIKYGWLGKKNIRFVSITPDLLYITWKAIGAEIKSASYCLLSQFSSVESGGHNVQSLNNRNGKGTVSSTSHATGNSGSSSSSGIKEKPLSDKDECMIIMYGQSSGGKTLFLEYADRVSAMENKSMAMEWTDALRYLVMRSHNFEGNENNITPGRMSSFNCLSANNHTSDMHYREDYK